MQGNISRIVENRKYDQTIIKTYGFIFAEDGEEYFFHKNDLVNCNIRYLQEGDSVSFSVAKSEDGRLSAVKVRKNSSSVDEEPIYEVSPGVNPNVNLNNFNDDEKRIINILKKTFYITNSGSNIKMGDSFYRYILVKPTNYFHFSFNMTREIPVIFSDYITFEPRILDVASVVISKFVKSKLRLDRSCQILISNDSNIEKRMSDILKDSNLDSIVIPFSYREFVSQNPIGEQQIKDRFRKYLFDADLFSNSDPIKNDVFFFGRRDYARDIANKCKQSSNCGIFGLRRSGKTSMLYAIKRILEGEGYKVLFIPCQSELVTLNWEEALYQIVRDISEIMYSDNPMLRMRELHSEGDYNARKANISFEEDVNLLLADEPFPIVLMFDEIESITFDVASSGEQWRDGENYVMFWNIIRGFRTKYQNKLSVVIAGTNPMINEIAILKSGRDNPMFGQISSSNQGTYLIPFDIESTKTMINTLGGYMGIKFTDNIAAAITDDCGGHPYLTRMLCAYVNKYLKKENKKRPVEISKAIYQAAREEFEKSGDAEGFYLMILNILQSCYEKEFNALKILANEGDSQLSKTMDNFAMQHLLGYGLVENNEGHLAIRFDTIKRYLQGEYKFERTNLSIAEQKQEIQTRFDSAELKLRSLVRVTLRTTCGVSKAKLLFLEAMEHSPSVSQKVYNDATRLEYKQLFDPSVNQGCFFSVLKQVIEENFDLFANVFETDLETVSRNLRILNRSRRPSSHSFSKDAENWSEDDFIKFRKAMSWLESVLINYD